MRRIVLLLALAVTLPLPAADVPPPELLQAVEFPYYLYPRTLWDRELVWLKTIGIRAVEFPIPWNWHQLAPGDFDFNGRTSPRRDLVGLIRVLRKLDMLAWVRPLPPVEGWRDAGTPPGADARARAAWLHELNQLLATQTASHGGPVAWVEGGVLSIDAAAAPPNATVISTTDPGALPASRDAIAAAASHLPAALLWTGVEDALYPAGWSDSLQRFRPGAVGLNGTESPVIAALRRDAAFLRNWSPLFQKLLPVPVPKPSPGKYPDGVSVVELASATASAVGVTNRGAQPFHDELRVVEPAGKRVLVIPAVTVDPADSLWLPLFVSLGPGGLCRECSNFSAAEHIVYATAELDSIEFENGILAMEFVAPVAGEVILQLARQPVGPYLAAGVPSEFDWDDKTLRARLKIPAGPGPAHRVRVGIAMEEPETSGFFDEARRLILGQKNTVSTTYSSADVARRSRLRMPEGFTAERTVKSPNEIQYEINVPADLPHGDHVTLALEADGMLLGRARVQIFRPASIRLVQAMALHVGSRAEVAPDPPIATVEPKAGTNLEISILNNDPAIRTYHLEAAGGGLEFFPPKQEVVVGGQEERRVSLRVFAADGAVGLRDWTLRAAGLSKLDLPMRALLVPRGQTAAFAADLDGDGSPEWVLESQKVRVVFSETDGGRWLELYSKDHNVNFLGEEGAFAAKGPVKVQAEGDRLEFTGDGWHRTVRLAQNVLSIEQTTPLPPDRLEPVKHGNLVLAIERPSPARAVYTLE